MTDIFICDKCWKDRGNNLLMEPYNHTRKDIQSYINIQNKIIIFWE